MTTRSCPQDGLASKMSLKWRLLVKLLVVYDRNRRAYDTTVGAYVSWWKALGRTCAGIFFRFVHVDMPFVCYSDEVEYLRRLSDWLQKVSNSEKLDFACCCLRKPFYSYYLVQDAEEYVRKLDLEAQQRMKDDRFLVGLNNLEFFALPPAKHFLFYVSVHCFGTRLGVCSYCVCRLNLFWSTTAVRCLVAVVAIHSGLNE